MHNLALKLGNENSAQSFSDRSCFVPPWGHGHPRLRVMGCPHQNACFFQDFEGLTEVFAPRRPPGYPHGRPRHNPAPKLTLWAAFSFLINFL